MPGVEPIHDWHGNRPDFPSVEYGRQEKNPQMIPPIQIGPISAKAMSEPIVDRAVRLMKDEELWQ
jgi:hypothetical protein